MAIYQAKCISCDHQFYVLETDCKKVEVVNCPLCMAGVEIINIKKPVNRDWGGCHKKDKQCSGCKKLH